MRIQIEGAVGQRSTKPPHFDVEDTETVRQIIDTVKEDVRDIERFYNVTFSPTRIHRLQTYLKHKRTELDAIDWRDLDLQSQIDIVLLRNWIARQLAGLAQAATNYAEAGAYTQPFVENCITLIETRNRVERIEGERAASILSDVLEQVHKRSRSLGQVQTLTDRETRFIAYRSLSILAEIRDHLQEWFGFYDGYDPVFTWWVKRPHQDVCEALDELASIIQQRLGLSEGKEETIVGQPIGLEGLSSALKHDLIAYSPEDLIRLAEQEYRWCEQEARKASRTLGHGDDWRVALEQVKTMYVAPGEQTYLVHELSQEAVAYVQKHDLITIPKIADECWRTTMMTPARQKVNPFFLGGTKIIVSYPTDTMSHADKMMSLRGNARPLSRSTVFHELIPGHHLQYHCIARHRPYRRMFMNAYWIEGWAFYWEMNLWNHGFVEKAEDKIGMLFWRMHRCIRIIFSLKFHLNQLTPEECIDLLVERVGHERATAEGEVRRSFNGDYPPLYQIGYMIGALQFTALRRELVEEGEWSEKAFHDTVMKQGPMPIEVLRALLKRKELRPDHQAEWKFYDFV